MEGPLEGIHLHGERRKALIMAIEEAIGAGLTERAACAAVALSERRFRRWRVRAREGDYARHRKPADVRPINALTPEEHEAIREAVACAEWADLSCRELSITILETQERYISHVAIWEYERTQGLAGHRGKRRLMGRHRGAAPDTSFVQRPNQLWTWDFTKIPTGVPHQCWWLVAIEDQYSRKVVGWAMGARATTELAKVAWDAALLVEGGTSEVRPFSLSDRGPQMRSGSMREFFQDLSVARLFARPRTPNDNPYIESLFSTVKTHPAYPEAFPTLEVARAYFEPFFHWYNEEHLHTRIGMVTPSQKHSGEWRAILADRERIKAKTFAARRAYHVAARGHNKILEADIS